MTPPPTYIRINTLAALEEVTEQKLAEEVLRRWRESEGRVAEALAGLGEELAAARDGYGEVKELDETLFAKDYESL